MITNFLLAILKQLFVKKYLNLNLMEPFVWWINLHIQKNNCKIDL